MSAIIVVAIITAIMVQALRSAHWRSPVRSPVPPPMGMVTMATEDIMDAATTAAVPTTAVAPITGISGTQEVGRSASIGRRIEPLSSLGAQQSRAIAARGLKLRGMNDTT